MSSPGNVDPAGRSAEGLVLHLLIHWSPAWPLPKWPPTVCMQGLCPGTLLWGSLPQQELKAGDGARFNPHLSSFQPQTTSPSYNLLKHLQQTRSCPQARLHLHLGNFPLKVKSLLGVCDILPKSELNAADPGRQRSWLINPAWCLLPRAQGRGFIGQPSNESSTSLLLPTWPQFPHL